MIMRHESLIPIVWGAYLVATGVGVGLLVGTGATIWFVRWCNTE